MEGKASHKDSLIVIKWMGPLACLLLWVSPALSIEIYQWTDPRGIINFTDNLKSVPEAIRDSPQLIVRKDLFIHETPANPASQQAYPQVTRIEQTEPQPHSVEFNQTIINYPPTTSIIVVNSGIRRVRKRPFPVHRKHGPSFARKSSKGGQYIYPGAHSRQYIHPKASRQPRRSSRRGFAGRRHFHRRAITGRRR
jgi:hypothetical protein